MASSSKTEYIRLHEVFCREHPDAPLVEDYYAGDMICTECGIVIGDRVVDVGTESNDKTDKYLCRDGASEVALDGHGKLMYRNRRTLKSSDRVLTMADRLHLPRVIADRANTLFKKVHKTLRGRRNDVIAAACLYIACRQEEVPRTFNEISAVSHRSKKEIGRMYKLIRHNHGTNVKVIKAGDFMPRFCSNLGLPYSVQKLATHIARRTLDLGLTKGCSPVSVTAAAIYMASHAWTAHHKKTREEEVKSVTPLGQLPKPQQTRRRGARTQQAWQRGVRK